MTNVIDINQYKKNKEDVPDPIHTYTDVNGVVWFIFVCSYTDNDGSLFGFHIWAKDAEDAKKRIESIKTNAVVDGQLFTEIEYN